MNIEMTSADIAALVNKYDGLKQAVLAKYLEDNAPVLVITDLVESDTGTEVAAS